MSVRAYVLSAVLAIGLAAGYLLVSGGATGRAPRCPGCNVILLSLDQVRAKSLPCFGYREDTAPNLCALASRSHIYTNAYATASRTMDSHFSMITSRYPSGHRMNLPYASALPESVPTVAQLLKTHGYRTYYLGVTSDPHLPIAAGLGRGIDRVIDADDPNEWPEIFQGITARDGTASPAFYFLHTYEAHEPYMPDAADLLRFNAGPQRTMVTYDHLCRYTYRKLSSLHPRQVPDIAVDEGEYCAKIDEYTERFVNTFEDFNDTYTIFNEEFWHQFDDMSVTERARFTHALYAAQIYRLDRKLGAFFDYLKTSGVLDRTIVIVVGDQGDEFYEHGSYSHGWSLYDEVLHVPFIVYVPGAKPFVSDKLTSLVDIVPTVMDILGKPYSIPTDGISLFSRKSHTAVLSEHVSDGAIALRTDAYTFIRRIVNGAFQMELYDRRDDPGEQKNIFRGNDRIVETLLTRYRDISANRSATESASPLPGWLDEGNRKRLIESGYF